MQTLVIQVLDLGVEIGALVLQFVLLWAGLETLKKKRPPDRPTAAENDQE